VKGYASRFSDGSIGLALINESAATRKIRLKLTGLPDTVQFENAYWYEVYAGNIKQTNKKFYINGQTRTTPGGGPEEFSRIEPYCAPFTNDAMIRLHPYSANFMVIRLNKTTAGLTSTHSGEIKVYPNPVEKSFRIPGGFKILSLEIFNVKAEKFSEAHFPEEMKKYRH